MNSVARRILAHRGSWTSGQSPNSLPALLGAVSDGYSFECDIRDSNGKLVLSHDPPVELDSCPTLESLVENLNSTQFDGIAAFNIKSDGLAPALQDLAFEHFYFDMSFPQSVIFRNSGRVTASRWSEFESIDLENQEPGEYFWVDCFESDWYIDPPIWKLDTVHKSKLVLVSPELHGRDPAKAWEVIARDFTQNESLHICTDHPEKFEELVWKSAP